MQSTSISVDEFKETVLPERKAALIRLRDLCIKLLNGFDETMEYGMPTYKRHDKAEVSFNSQKNFIALYILRKDVLDTYRPQWHGASIGKGCIRYSKVEKMDSAIIEKLLEGTRQSTGIICG